MIRLTRCSFERTVIADSLTSVAVVHAHSCKHGVIASPACEVTKHTTRQQHNPIPLQPEYLSKRLAMRIDSIVLEIEILRRLRVTECCTFQMTKVDTVG